LIRRHSGDSACHQSHIHVVAGYAGTNYHDVTIMSPLEKGDHPELDDSPLLDAEGIQNFQFIIGPAQSWAVSLGRLDIEAAIITFSSFRSQHHGSDT
jgi:hypothetical protein